MHNCVWWRVTNKLYFIFALHSNQIKQYTKSAIFLLQENASIAALSKTPTSSIGLRTKAALRETPKAALRKTPYTSSIGVRTKAALRETPTSSVGLRTKAALRKTPTSSIGVRTKAALRETPKAALRKTPTSIKVEEIRKSCGARGRVACRLLSDRRPLLGKS